jgi:AAA+ ATPase superfamily predicted ATPase
MAKLIGRKSELYVLKSARNNDKSELIAIYGRRRVGKTFLIREFFKNEIVFEVGGLYRGTMKFQLENFTKELNKRSTKGAITTPTSWLSAFTLLENYLDRLRSKKKKVVFIDEFPWLATQKSSFLMAFENFWNQYCTKRADLIVVICGSAASYMVQNIIKNKGGLHNRITRTIRLLPFNLNETKLFLKSRGINYTLYDILQLYMTMGGIPHYLDKIEKGKSVVQNIDALCFEKNGILVEEFNQLYTSLFDDSEKHLQLIKTLASSHKGLTRAELIKKSKIPSGGDFTRKMEELIESGFVTEMAFYQNKSRFTLYRLSDEYSIFYLKFIHENKNSGEGTWQRFYKKQAYVSWTGFSFETICMKHVTQIKSALGIDSVYSANRSWFNGKAQIDLIIDRDDHILNLCEMKFYNAPFTIDKKFYTTLKTKFSELDRESYTHKNIYIVLVTTYGIIQNSYSSELVSNVVKMDDLFLD